MRRREASPSSANAVPQDVVLGGTKSIALAHGGGPMHYVRGSNCRSGRGRISFTTHIAVRRDHTRMGRLPVAIEHLQTDAL